MELNNKIDYVKLAASSVVGFGTSRIIGAIIQNNVNTDSVIDKVTVTSATLVFGMIASDKTKAYTDTKIDEIIELCQKNN